MVLMWKTQSIFYNSHDWGWFIPCMVMAWRWCKNVYMALGESHNKNGGKQTIWISSGHAWVHLPWRIPNCLTLSQIDL